MTDKKQICICSYFNVELHTVIKELKVYDLDIDVFPAYCGKPQLDEKFINSDTRGKDNNYCIIGSACVKELSRNSKSGKILHYQNCFNMLLNEDLVSHFISEGAYIVTPGWLVNWKQEINKLGFDKKTATEFFNETCKYILLLDTKVDIDSQKHLQDFTSFINLNFKILPIGLDHFKLSIQNTINSLNDDRTKLMEKKVVDYTMILDLLVDLAESLNESEITYKILSIFSMLFAPSNFYYLPVIDDLPGKLFSKNEIENDTLIVNRLMSNKTDHDKSDTQVYKLLHENKLLGIVEISDLAFPQYIEYYNNIATSIISICALAVSNSRSYQHILDQRDELSRTLTELKETQKLLVESQKMAALGNLVAGVAHEVNTPVGICITATSGYLDRVKQLELLFNSGKLSKSEFKKSLDKLKISGELILKNLNRTSQLVKSFKLVSTDEVSEREREFNLKQYLHEIINSISPTIKDSRIRISIDGNDDIILLGYPGVMAQIISNLTFNSVKHAFKDCKEPKISIVVKEIPDFVFIIFSDNGSGIPEENISKIFDPFYTTNKQGGSGLGLHITYNLINQKLGGTIECKNNDEKGVRFIVKIPVK